MYSKHKPLVSSPSVQRDVCQQLQNRKYKKTNNGKRTNDSAKARPSKSKGKDKVRILCCQNCHFLIERQNPGPSPKAKIIEIDAEESDEAERLNERGPKNQSRQHFYDPIAVIVKGSKRWMFKCRHAGCTCKTTVPRTVGDGADFADEPQKPPLGNLATHVRKVHANALPAGLADATDDVPLSQEDARIMERFLKRGAENPTHEPTQEGFYRYFAAWCLEENLAFTLGESAGAQRLFNYIKLKFKLPTDTTVRNKLDKIYDDLHDHVVQEIKFGVHWIPDNAYIHCLDHIVSLVVQKIMNTLEEADDPDITDYHASNKQHPSHYSADDDPVLQELEAEFDKEMDEAEERRVAWDTEKEDDQAILDELLRDVDEWSAIKKVM
ncbi:hypothetical protein EV421DRAFT_1720940 [Armillaria borealis]|uniref:Uncharacterized protein n=1 Tax=Armillaria borealis TaxID=47425 RepID=A0AA39IWS3_9AGAR|nr:hypothetical protein EV421DRAFT_1720940 [Armillaria borealis]